METRESKEGTGGRRRISKQVTTTLHFIFCEKWSGPGKHLGEERRGGRITPGGGCGSHRGQRATWLEYYAREGIIRA